MTDETEGEAFVVMVAEAWFLEPSSCYEGFLPSSGNKKKAPGMFQVVICSPPREHEKTYQALRLSTSTRTVRRHLVKSLLGLSHRGFYNVVSLPAFLVRPV